MIEAAVFVGALIGFTGGVLFMGVVFMTRGGK